jgi:hypothetical protein
MNMPLGAPKSITQCRRFFSEPVSAKQRIYEALRAFFLDGGKSAEVARAFGYTPGTFRVMCHQFRRDPEPAFFIAARPGPRHQPKKSAAREIIVSLRKSNHSVYEISQLLKEQKLALSPTAVREVLRTEGFAALPRRLDEERPKRPGPTVEEVADARRFSLTPRKFSTQCGGLFLFIPDLVRLNLSSLAEKADLPGSKMIPAGHALRAALALKLWSVERKGHIMSLVADPGLALYAALNAIPKKSYFSEYSSQITPKNTHRLLAGWHECIAADKLFDESSFNLDFHSVPYYGEHPVVESHYVSMRSRSQPSILVFMAQDATGRAFCYSNADLRKGEEADEVLKFVEFWKAHHGENPRHLVFDSKLTTYKNLVRLDDLSIPFITLRRRSPKIRKEVDALPPSAWRRVELDVPARKYKNPRIFEQNVKIENREFRQIYVIDLGHEEPTVLLTNQRNVSVVSLITRYAQRMLIENALSDAVRFFHMDALSSAVGLKVDYDMSLLVIASGLYRLLARRMRGYEDAQARQIFRDLIDLPATVTIAPTGVRVDFHRRAHLPLILASDLANQPVRVPWWNNLPLTLTTDCGTRKC